MKRIQTGAILADLQKKMVLITGPRQAGKTTIAEAVMTHYQHPVYLNYDHRDHREVIAAQSWLPTTDLLVLDELHKMPEWKNYLKGLYDTKPPHLHILVTGSARLEVFSDVGDSLAGRYFLHRLLPFSIAELHQLEQPLDIEKLLRHGNFPEPYLADLIDAKRWRLQYIDSLIRTDVLAFENIADLRGMQTLFELLRRRVGLPISYQSLAQDIGASPNTVKKYISILEALYIVFTVTPYHKNIARSLLKEPKIYFHDVGLVSGDKGVLIENLVAMSLLKHCFGRSDYQAESYKLQYLRTKDQREVDFVLVLDEQITEAIEVKLLSTDISPPLKWFVDKYHFKATQVVYTDKAEFVKAGITVRQLTNYLKELWPF